MWLLLLLFWCFATLQQNLCCFAAPTILRGQNSGSTKQDSVAFIYVDTASPCLPPPIVSPSLPPSLPPGISLCFVHSLFLFPASMTKIARRVFLKQYTRHNYLFTRLPPLSFSLSSSLSSSLSLPHCISLLSVSLNKPLLCETHLQKCSSSVQEYGR